MHPNIPSSTIYNSEDLKASQVSVNIWMNKEDLVYAYNGILPSHKNKEILPITETWMDIKSDKDKYYMITIICGN